jgi:hypothetical protein
MVERVEARQPEGQGVGAELPFGAAGRGDRIARGHVREADEAQSGRGGLLGEPAHAADVGGLPEPDCHGGMAGITHAVDSEVGGRLGDCVPESVVAVDVHGCAAVSDDLVARFRFQMSFEGPPEVVGDELDTV